MKNQIIKIALFSLLVGFMSSCVEEDISPIVLKQKRIDRPSSIPYPIAYQSTRNPRSR